MEGCTNREGIFWKGLGCGSAGDDGNMAEPGGHLARKALRRRKPQAAGVHARPTLLLGTGVDMEAAANRKGRRRADASIGPYAGGRLASGKACATAASLSAGPFRPAGAGRSLIGRPGELLWDEKRGTTRHGPYGVANAAILGRPHLAPGDSQEDRGPLEPCPAPRN